MSGSDPAAPWKVSQGRRQSDDPGDLSAGSGPVCLSGQDPAAPLKLRQRSGQADRDSDLSAGSCPTCPRCGWPEDDEHTELSCAVEIVVTHLGDHDFGGEMVVTARLADTGVVRLKETGSVYVTRAATHQYQEARGIDGPEEARRELTEYLLDAKQSTDGTWRIRRRSLGVDLIVRVAHEDGLAVVVSLVSAREHHGAHDSTRRDGRGD